MKLGTIFAMLLTAMLWCSTVSQAHADGAAPIKIGVYLPLTGQNAFGGQLELEGVRLAWKEMPKVLDRPVELVVVDNKSDKVEAANVVKRLLHRDKVVALLGSYGSSLAIAGAEVAERFKVPGVGTSCTNPLVTQGRNYYFRACFIDPWQGAAAATWAYETLGLRKAAVLMDMTNDYAVGLASFFSRSFKKQGGSIVATLKYSSGDQDFTVQLNELMAKKPDIVFMPAYFAEGVLILKQAHALKVSFRFMGGDAMDNPETVALCGAAAEGFLHTTFPYDSSRLDMNMAAKHFTEAWKAAYPDKETNVNGALGYTAYGLLVDAIARARTTESQALTKALAETQNLPTPLGTLSINATHDAEMPVGIIEYTNGIRKYLGEVRPK